MPKAKTKSNIEIQPEQLNSINRALSTLAFALVAIIGIKYIATDLIAPILLAIFIAVLIYPIFKWFRGRGFSSGWSLFLMVITFFLGAGAIIVFLTWSFSLLGQSISAYVDAFKDSFVQTAETVNIDSETATNAVKSIDPQSVHYIGRLIFNSLGNFVFYFILIPILSILMVLQIDSLPKGKSLMLEKDSPHIQRFKKFAESISIYVSSRFKVNIATGVLFAISLIILGIDFPFVWGFLTIIMSFIPYIGIVIASIPPVILAFSTGGLPLAVLVIVAVTVINLFAENVLSPAILGKDNKISTAAVVISLLFWVWVLGPIGAILAVPLTVFLKLVLSDFKETRWLALLMEGNYDEGTKKSEAFYRKYINKALRRVNLL